MPAPWQNPLPLEEYMAIRIVIYYYRGRWIPIKFCRLEKAIKLHRKAALQGQELVVFPLDCDPNNFWDYLN